MADMDGSTLRIPRKHDTIDLQCIVIICKSILFHDDICIKKE